jgi:hypothetical protein
MARGAGWFAIPAGGGLDKIDARTASDTWAVGGGTTCHWKGSRWTSFPIGAPPNPQSSVDLRDVAVVSQNNAWAVGILWSSCGEGQLCAGGEIQDWNGSAWQHVTNALPIG